MKWYLFPGFLFIASCSVAPRNSNEKEHFFLTEVKPVLQQNCLRCHNGTLPPPSLNLTSRSSAFRKSAGGSNYLVPGNPDRSLLVTAVERPGTHLKLMPRTDLSLTDDQIGILREWIESGAFWPEGENGILKHQRSVEHP